MPCSLEVHPVSVLGTGCGIGTQRAAEFEEEHFTLALTPALSLGERETWLPRIDETTALDWRRFIGSRRDCFVEIFMVWIEPPRR
jgi:hypothetical protein